MTTAKKSDPWFVRKLIALGACSDAIKYARKYRTFPAAWRGCENYDWLRWLLQNLEREHEGVSKNRCPRCKWLKRVNVASSIQKIRRHFPADRVAEKLRQVK